MQKNFVINNLCRTWLVVSIMMLTVGCAGTSPQIVKAPTYSAIANQQAVYSGSRAIADCRRERFIASSERRVADYTHVRERLARALAVLRPSLQAPGAPEFEPYAICLETALTAIDRIDVAERQQDRQGAAIGWEMLDQSARSLLLVLDNQTTNAGGATVIR